MYFDDNKSREGHGQRALRSGAVSIAARSINAVIQIGSALFLARLLSPEDYGLVGMVTAITGFASVFVDFGSRDAIVQRPSIRERDVSALFWLTQTVGLGFTVIVAASAPWIARFYGEPRLTAITVVSSLTFICAALTAQHYALLRRAMMFRQLGTVEVIANVISAAVAITMALLGYHYWALVSRPIIASFFIAVGCWMQCRWIPGRPSYSSEVRSMLKFGVQVTGFTMTDFAGRSSDRVAIGYRVGAAGLGYYQNALFVYDNLIDIVVSPLHGVGVASLSKLRDNLPELRRSWAKAVLTLSFFAMPGFGLLSAMSQELIQLLLGPKWARSGILLTVLALRGMPHTVERTTGWLHVTAGRTDRWMRWGVTLACAQFVALFIGLPFGAIGVVTAYVITMFILFIPATVYAGAPLGIRLPDVISAVWRPLVSALVATGGTMALRPVVTHVPSVGRLSIITVVYSAFYVSVAVGILGVRTPLATIVNLCRGFLPAPVTRWLSPRSAVDTSPDYERI